MWPIRSSTLLPKISRNSMLPSRCSQPPCRNIAVKTDSGGDLSYEGGPTTQPGPPGPTPTSPVGTSRGI